MENKVLEAMVKRSSIRAYKDTPLTEEQMDALKCAALSSPTAMNRQSQRYLFITDTALIANIEAEVVKIIQATGNEAAIAHLASRDNKVLYDVPLLIVIAIEEGSDIAKVDAGIAVQNLALAATSLGLDSVILGNPTMAFQANEALVKRAQIPEGLTCAISIGIGYRDMDKEPHEVDASHIVEVK